MIHYVISVHFPQRAGESAMSKSTWNLKKLDDKHWEVTLTVDSREIESLKWIWTAQVSTGDSADESTIVLEPAQCIPEGMPEGDATGSHSFSRKFTARLSQIPIGEFKTVLDNWEKECREISAIKDTSVTRRRREIETRATIEERTAQNLRDTVTYLDSLAAESP